jgi:LmbE family N-acetylglucosaminyl deacetylase
MGTLVTFHAHPDDEAMLTAGLMARAAAAGHRVVLVVATRGEVGDTDPVTLAPGESLADRRAAETERSAELLGVDRVVFLGYHDSGHDPALAPPGSFVTAPVEEATTRLAHVLDEEGADVVTTYDPNGGYGHPDHRKVHEVGWAAAERAGTTTVLEATVNRDLFALAADLAPALGFEVPAELVPERLDEWYAAPDEITHAIDVTAFLGPKRASMEAHATQTTSAAQGSRTLSLFLALDAELFGVAFGTEWFIDRSARPGPPYADVVPGLELAPTR